MAANQGFSYNPGLKPGVSNSNSNDGYLLAPQPGPAYYVPPPPPPPHAPTLSPKTTSFLSPVIGSRAESERRQIAAVLALNDDLIQTSLELAACTDRSEAEKATVRTELLERIAANLQFLTALADRRIPGTEGLPVRPPTILNAPPSIPRLAKSYAQLQLLFSSERPQRSPISPPVPPRHGSFSSSNNINAPIVPIHVSAPPTFPYQQQHLNPHQNLLYPAYSQLHFPQNYWNNSGLQ